MGGLETATHTGGATSHSWVSQGSVSLGAGNAEPADANEAHLQGHGTGKPDPGPRYRANGTSAQSSKLTEKS